MSIRWLTALLAAFLSTVLTAGPGRAAEFTDSAGRIVVLPMHIDRVLTAGPTADVLVYVLVPDKLIGWSQPPQPRYLPPRYARLPVTGLALDSDPGVAAATIARIRPDLVIDAGPVTSARAALADRVQQLTRIPVILVGDTIARMPPMLRSLGVLLGVAARGDDLAIRAENAIASLRGRLLIQPAGSRPRVYYARGFDGLETALPGSSAGAVLDEAGVINVAGILGEGRDRVAVTPAQISNWAPTIVIAEDRGFYERAQRDPFWRRMPAVHAKNIYLVPSAPFGWIGDPPGLNRLVGLYWLSTLFYPDLTQDDLRTVTQEFYDAFYHVKLTAAQLDALVKPAESHWKPQGELSEILLGPAPPPLVGPTGLGPPGLGPPGRRGLPAGPGGPALGTTRP